MLANLLQDVRYCLRGFARRPMFAAVVIVTLALGLSANAAIFSIYDQILLRELPVPDPDGLVNLGSPGFKQGNTSCNDGGTCEEIFSYPMFRDLERVDGPFAGLAAHRYVDASLAFEGETAQIFMPRAQAPLLGEMSFYLRSTLSLPELRSAVMAVLARHDPNLPLMEFRTVTEQARENAFLDRFMSAVATTLAALAVVLAAVGIYGVLSYGVAQRLREIGLRIALGAAPQNVRAMVLKQVGWMGAIGVVVGVSLALLIGQAARALLFGLTPTDPLVPATAVLVLITVVFSAAYWPARRAALVDPVTALRGD